MAFGPLFFSPDGNQPPDAADAATPLVVNGRSLLEFPPSGTPDGVWVGFLPTTYAGGTITVRHFYACTNNAGNVVLEGRWERQQDNVTNITIDAFGGAQSVTDTVPGVTNRIGYADITFTSAQIAGTVAGEGFRYKATRNGGTSGGTVRLVGYAMWEA